MKSALLLCAAFLSAGAVRALTVDPSVTLNRIDPRIYGFLLEHIYHSCDNGVWGEEVFNRSFEDRADVGGYYVAGELADGDFEVSVTGPDSVVGVRDAARDGRRTNYVDWHVAEGYVEIATGWRWYSPSSSVTRVSSARKGAGLARIEVRGDRVRGWLEGEPCFEATCEKGGRGLVVSGRDAPFGLVFPLWKHWTLEGDVEATISRESFNDATAARLVVGPRGGALVQRGTFTTHRGDPVTGSCYVKTKGKPWVRRELSLPDRDDPDAELRLEFPEGEYLVDQVSLMSASSRAVGGFRTNLLAAVRGLAPAILRWPGGSFVEHYDWRNGIGPQESRRGILRWNDHDPLSFGTDEYLRYCELLGAEPHIVLPIGYHNWTGWSPEGVDWTARALDWIAYVGRKVRIFELDNETWKMNPEAYAAAARRTVEAIRRLRPDATLIACGSGRLGAEGVGLDEAVRTNLADVVDFVSPHHYQKLARFGSDGVEEMRRYIVSRGMPVAFTEWNLEGQDLRTGLFAAGFLNMLERTPACPIAEAALLLRHTSAPGWDNAFINFDRRGWYYAPNGVVFGLWSRNRQPRRIAVADVPDGLDAVATASEDGRTLVLKLVNATAGEISLPMAFPRGYTVESWRGVTSERLTDRNTMEEPNRIGVVSWDVPRGMVWRVPPSSASVVRCAKQL